MTEDESETIISQIGAQLGVGLVSTDVMWAGARSKGMRLAGISSAQSFSIGLEKIARKAEAFLIMDRFAGPVIRAMEEMATSAESEWPTLVRAAKERGINTSVMVNNSYLDDTLSNANSPWSSLEVDCSKRISMMDVSLDAMVDVGTACLAMALSVLVIDWGEGAGEQEGAMSRTISTRYERSPINRLRCIQHYGSTCWVCDTDFGQDYGAIGAGFIEVHHRTPVSKIGAGYVVDPIRDLIPLCSNCHSMIHRQNPPFKPQELRALMGKGPKYILE